MSVFKNAVTLSVACVMFGASNASAVWDFPVDPPVPPTINNIRTLVDPSVSEIQNAIAPRTRIEIIGDVDASNGQRISINVDDVKLNFKRASLIRWSGNDTWTGFVEVSSHRVELLN